MDKNRLIQYLSSNISPINIIEEYQEKRLPVSILFYKVCSSFPKEKLGQMKTSFKHIQSQKYQSFSNILTPEEISSIIKNQNSIRPKTGQYIEYLVLSYLQTCLIQPELMTLSSAQEDIQGGYDFTYFHQKYDISTNQNKIPRPDVKLIYFSRSQILDQDNLLLPEAFKYIGEVLKQQNIALDVSKEDYTQTICNKVRVKYIELYNHKVRLVPEEKLAIIEKAQSVDLEVPEYMGQSLPVSSISTKTQSLSLDTLSIAQKIETLSPIEKQQIEIIVNTMINSKQ